MNLHLLAKYKSRYSVNFRIFVYTDFILSESEKKHYKAPNTQLLEDTYFRASSNN